MTIDTDLQKQNLVLKKYFLTLLALFTFDYKTSQKPSTGLSF